MTIGRMDLDLALALACLCALRLPVIDGITWMPRSFVDELIQRETSQGEKRHLEEQCPPILGDVCESPLDTTEKWQSCVDACQAATCCQDSQSLGFCGSDCPAECGSYIACLTIGPPPVDDPSDTCSILSVDHYQGFNLHFSIRHNQAQQFMPDSRFSPMKLIVSSSKPTFVPYKRTRLLRMEERGVKFSQQGGSGTNASGYYISLYATTIGVNFQGNDLRVGRADLFTYAIDPENKPCLVLLAAFMEVPESLQSNAELLAMYKIAIESLALDSTTGELAFPHYFVFDFDLDETGFSVGKGDLGDAVLQVRIDQSTKARDDSFPLDFVLANSLAYRSVIDKNINYFNAAFIAAPVKAYPVKDKNFEALDIDALLNLLPDGATLKYLQAYGINTDPISWHFDDYTESSGTPYLTLAEKQERVNFKKQAFSNIWNDRAADIQAGTADPLIKLVVQSGSIYLNWEITDEGVQSLSDLLNLESLGMQMEPISILADEQPRYFLSLNSYNSVLEGLPEDAASSVRFEYSIYVSKKNNVSKSSFYMVIKALSSVDSLDPVNVFVEASNISYERKEGALTLAANTETETWTAEISVSSDEMLEVEKSWIVANDEIYWANGIADQAFYDSSTTSQMPFRAAVDSFSGSHPFDAFLVDANNPYHSFVFEKPLDFVLNPWFNIDVAPLPPESKLVLQQVKREVYGGLAQLTAVNIALGEQEPLVDTVVQGATSVSGENLPRMLLNFEILIQDLRLLETAMALPENYHIVPMSVTTDSAPKHILTLAILSETGPSTFNKAAWTTYVKDDKGHTFLNEFHVETFPEANIDIVEILKPPASIFTVSETEDGLLHVNIQNGAISVDAAVPFPPTDADHVRLTDSWTRAHDRVIWQKGVYDKLYYNGLLTDATVVAVDASKAVVHQTTPWSSFVCETPFEVLFFPEDVKIVRNPWYNLEEV